MDERTKNLVRARGSYGVIGRERIGNGSRGRALEDGPPWPQQTQRRYARWVQTLRNEKVLSNQINRYMTMTVARVDNQKDIMVIACAAASKDGRDRPGCVQCCAPMPGRHDNYNRDWPPPPGWRPLIIERSRTPVKLREYRISFMTCPDCSTQFQNAIDYVELLSGGGQ